MRFAPDVRIEFFDVALGAVLRWVTLWSCRTGIDVIVIRVNDGCSEPGPDLGHTFDLTVDIQTLGHKRMDLDSLASALRVVLVPQFAVTSDTDHVHVEWDMHRGPYARGRP
jgi:hypothetical protein